jgi:ABC-type transporter Mla maintaining outer membrane lipid asymmetry ATPase subunit MlaF
MTAVVVTHDIHGARKFADRLILLRDGKIAMEGTFADLQKSKDSFVAQFLKNAC